MKESLGIFGNDNQTRFHPFWLYLRMKNFILFFLILMLSSCTLVAKLIYGVKTPKPRSVSYVLNHAEKLKLNHFTHYTMSYEGFLNLFSNSENLGVQSSINQAILFNEFGQLITLRDSLTCSSQYQDLIQGFRNSEITEVNSAVYFSDIFCDSLSVLGKKRILFDPSGNKPLFVLTWASFVGRLNESTTKIWADSISNIVAEGKAEAIFLNLDLKEGWKIDVE